MSTLNKKMKRTTSSSITESSDGGNKRQKVEQINSEGLGTGAIWTILCVFRERVKHIPKDLIQKQKVLNDGLKRFEEYFAKIVQEKNLKLKVSTDLAYVSIRPVVAWLLKQEGQYNFDDVRELAIVVEVGRNSNILKYHYDRYEELQFTEAEQSQVSGFAKGSQLFIGHEKQWGEAIDSRSFNASNQVKDTKVITFDYPGNFPVEYRLNGFSSLNGRNLYLRLSRKSDRIWKTVEHELAHNSSRYSPDNDICLNSTSLLSPFKNRGYENSGVVHMPCGVGSGTESGSGNESGDDESSNKQSELITIPRHVEGGQLYEFIFYGKPHGASPFCWDSELADDDDIERF